MSKDYYVLRGGKVVYKPGHYDVEGARATALRESKAHPRAVITVVKIVDQLQNAKDKPKVTASPELMNALAILMKDK